MNKPFNQVFAETVKYLGVAEAKRKYLSIGNMEEWEFNWRLAQMMGQVGTLGQLRLVPMNDGMQEARYPTVS